VGLADGELRGDRNGLAAGERLGEGLGVVAAGGLGVGFEVGVGGTVTVMLPPGADAPVDAMNVTVHVPADRTRADLDQVWPEGGAVSAIEIGAAPLRVSRAVMDVGLGLRTESTRKAKIVLVVPLRGPTDPLRRLFLARTGVTVNTRAATSSTSDAPTRLRGEGRYCGVTMDEAAKRAIP